MINHSNVHYTREASDYEDAVVFIVCEDESEWKRCVTKWLDDGHVGHGDFDRADSRYSEWVEWANRPVPVEVIAEFEKYVNAIYARFGASPLRYWAGKYLTGEINGSPETCC